MLIWGDVVYACVSMVCVGVCPYMGWVCSYRAMLRENSGLWLCIQRRLFAPLEVTIRPSGMCTYLEPTTMPLVRCFAHLFPYR